MLIKMRCLLWFGVLLAWQGIPGFAQEQAKERTPPIATDGRVEVNEIRIYRAKVSGAVPEADLTNMRISLWVDVKDEDASNFLVRLTNLDVIVDDTGKTLSTAKRRKQIDSLVREIRAREMRSFRSRNGPVIQLLLDAPSRNALRIKRIKGQVEVIPVGNETIVFNNFPLQVGKKLKHDLLSETNVVPRIEIEDNTTEVTLEITGLKDRLIDWTIAKNEKPLRSLSMSQSGSDNALQTSLGKGYQRFQPDKNTSLLIAVTTVGAKQIIDFEFINIELP